ncbi:hypothetical protein PR202_ga28578 [Eleusine coracana subsp. coracana]|uniref:F-box domain-containing protein n=1 Tax=Eleusine coracana subsp. coracana TaxID=191504 RepID=A0AAV5DJU4_ELECO|nr:hypothetical protein PR202_ga28578 [Eleusine coracana subsp. coracana]
MAQSGGEVAAKRPNLFPSGEDRLSALPDDIIVLILLRLDTIAEAARTSVLSSRWCRIWTLLPELTFRKAADYGHIRDVIAATEAPPLRQIRVKTNDDAPDSMAAWLPLAARRLSGVLRYRNSVEGHYEDDEDEDNTTIALPCFGKATKIVLNLGFLALALPSSGEFTRLTNLSKTRPVPRHMRAQRHRLLAAVPMLAKAPRPASTGNGQTHRPLGVSLGDGSGLCLRIAAAPY